MPDKLQLTQAIKEKAAEIGFTACGIAQPHVIISHKERYVCWLNKGYHAKMKFLETHLDKRFNPDLLHEGTKSIICVALNYYPAQKIHPDQLQFAYYAYGKDYHDIMKHKLKLLYDYINEKLFPINGRIFCDTAPLLERYWANQAGIGWIGKNNLLILPKAGSFFFLGEIMVDIELVYDAPINSLCGNCQKCIEACPSKALEGAYNLNANKCLSYLSIENRGEIPQEIIEVMDNCIYGCDICQKVCPWNIKYSTPTSVNDFAPHPLFMDMQEEDWSNLTPEKYQEIFKGSAVKRAKYIGLKRNIEAVTKKKEIGFYNLNE